VLANVRLGCKHSSLLLFYDSCPKAIERKKTHFFVFWADKDNFRIFAKNYDHSYKLKVRDALTAKG